MKLKTLIWSHTIDAHIARHQVNRDEVSEVIFSQSRLALKGRGGVVQVFGQTESGRYLKVIVKDHGDSTGFVITSLEMTSAERKLYHKRRKGS